MKNTEFLESMLNLQQKLNDNTNGTGWEDGYTKDGKLISWRRCIYMECAELIDSFAWKHWKSIKSPTNWDNVRIELVDIWHFILSLLLEERGKKDLAFIAMELSSINAFKDFIKEKGTPSDDDMYAIISDIELIVHKCSGFGFDMGELLSAFFTLCIKCGLNLESLYKIYIGKNVLNAFRQAHGYKEGHYKKMWNDKEDNEILNEILSQTLGYEEIYKELEKRYKAVL